MEACGNLVGLQSFPYPRALGQHSWNVESFKFQLFRLGSSTQFQHHFTACDIGRPSTHFKSVLLIAKPNFCEPSPIYALGAQSTVSRYPCILRCTVALPTVLLYCATFPPLWSTDQALITGSSSSVSRFLIEFIWRIQCQVCNFSRPTKCISEIGCMSRDWF